MKKEIGHSNSKKGNWLMSKPFDLLVLFLPIWIVWAVFFSNASYFQSHDLPAWAWVVFILIVDVGHVWSSLFRTYLEKDEFKTHRKLLLITPILVLTISVLLLSYSILLFWSVMAYVAVFHFVKQQYGFLALYRLKSGEKHKNFISDKCIIYVATIYPIVFWHFNSTANFNWFIKNDFIQLHTFVSNPEIVQTVFFIANWAYWIFIFYWLFTEIKIRLKGGTVSIGKLLWVITTAVNWWFGIVYFNSDIIFSVSNVIAHGIPYIALIYFYRNRKREIQTAKPLKTTIKIKWLLTLILTIVLIALVEEYFWDMLLLQEHASFFQTIYPYNWPQLTNKWPVIFAIALLAMPQQVHYILDGFIWKMNPKNKYLKPIFKPKDES